MSVKRLLIQLQFVRPHKTSPSPLGILCYSSFILLFLDPLHLFPFYRFSSLRAFNTSLIIIFLRFSHLRSIWWSQHKIPLHLTRLILVWPWAPRVPHHLLPSSPSPSLNPVTISTLPNLTRRLRSSRDHGTSGRKGGLLRSTRKSGRDSLWRSPVTRLPRIYTPSQVLCLSEDQRSDLVLCRNKLR